MTRIVTVGPSGSDYTSLSSAISGTVTAHTDPVTDGQPWEFVCYAFTDSPATLSSIATSSTNGIKVTVADGEWHEGVAGQGYTIAVGFNGNGLTVNTDHTTVERINFTGTTGTSVRSTIGTTGSIARNILAQATIQLSSLVVENSLVDKRGQTTRDCFNLSFASGTLSNCAGIGGDRGFATFSSTSLVVKNCVAFDNATVAFAAGVNAASDYNAADDTSAPGANSVDNITSAAFTDYAGGDYTPATGGALDGSGTDLSAFFTDDITGATRTQWDIGAYGIISAGGTTIDAAGVQSTSSATAAAGTLTANQAATLQGVAATSGATSAQGTLVAESAIPQALSGQAAESSATAAQGILTANQQVALAGVAAQSQATAGQGNLTANAAAIYTGQPAESVAQASPGTLVNDSTIPVALTGQAARSSATAAQGAAVVGRIASGQPATSEAQASAGAAQSGSVIPAVYTGAVARSQATAATGAPKAGVQAQGRIARCGTVAYAGQAAVGWAGMGAAALSQAISRSGQLFLGSLLARPIINTSTLDVSTLYTVTDASTLYSVGVEQ